MKWLAHTWVRLRGWRFEGEPPTASKYVAIGGPHTSNWDFVFFLAVAHHFKMNAKVIGKHTLVEGPFGWIMRKLGLIPVKRDSHQGVVEQMVTAFNGADEMALVIAPEGTRGAEPYWRSGFYRIALAANVPIVMAKLNSITKVASISAPYTPTGDVADDMNAVRAFFADSHGIKPAGESTVRLRDEDTRPVED